MYFPWCVIDVSDMLPTVGAKLPHLFKYTQAYETLYPGATQILVQNFPSSFWSSQKTLVRSLFPLTLKHAERFDVRKAALLPL
jgi:hypothetical protein